MPFVQVGDYYINLANVTYVERSGDKLLVFFCKSTNVRLKRAGDRLDLAGAEAEQFERLLKTVVQDHS